MYVLFISASHCIFLLFSVLCYFFVYCVLLYRIFLILCQFVISLRPRRTSTRGSVSKSKQGIFIVCTTAPSSLPHQLRNKWVLKNSFRRAELFGLGTGHSLSHTTTAKSAWSCITSPPYIFLAQFLRVIRHRKKFSFFTPVGFCIFYLLIFSFISQIQSTFIFCIRSFFLCFWLSVFCFIVLSFFLLVLLVYFFLYFILLSVFCCVCCTDVISFYFYFIRPFRSSRLGAVCLKLQIASC